MNYSALEIARHIINFINKEYCITNLKLQRILYFLQIYFIKYLNTTCFKDNIEYRSYGPVVPEVFEEFKEFGSSNIPSIINYTIKVSLFENKIIEYKDNTISEEVKEIIDKVVRELNSKYSSFQLYEISKNSLPYKEAYKNKIISIESIRKFYLKPADFE